MRNTITVIALVTLFGFGALVTAQQESADKAIEKKNGAEISADEMERLIAGLGDEKFASREAAHTRLGALGEQARPWLKKALDSDDPEVRWRASRLLCALDEDKKDAARKGAPSPKGLDLDLSQGSDRPNRRLFRFFDEDHDMFNEELSEHLNGLFGDLFEERFKPFHCRFVGDDQIELDDLLEQFERQTGELSIQLQDSVSRYNFQKTEDGRTVNFSLTLSEDGAVEARVRRLDEDGKEKEEVYSAKSLEEFKKSYPEVAEEFQLDGFQVSVQIPRMFGKPRQGLGLRLDRAPLGFSRKLHRKVLGVYTREPSPVLRAHLNLDEKAGLIVTETTRGSFARQIGLQAMDVIVSINSKPVKSADDIRRIISTFEEAEAVTVEIIRNGARQKLEGKYPAAGPK